jgi:hypothetical protein
MLAYLSMMAPRLVAARLSFYQYGEAPAYAGTDLIIARDSRITAVYLFFDKLPGAGRSCHADITP